MGTVADLMQLLDRVKVWRELQGLPARVRALEERLATLDKAPAADGCPMCRRGRLQTVKVEPHPDFFDIDGSEFHTLRCTTEGCGHTTRRLVP